MSKETTSEFIKREDKKLIISLALSFFVGSFGGLRFYQKRYVSGLIMFLLTVSSFFLLFSAGLSLDAASASIFTNIHYLISFSLFGVVIYDVVKVFKTNKQNKLEKLKELKENAS